MTSFNLEYFLTPKRVTFDVRTLTYELTIEWNTIQSIAHPVFEIWCVLPINSTSHQTNHMSSTHMDTRYCIGQFRSQQMIISFRNQRNSEIENFRARAKVQFLDGRQLPKEAWPVANTTTAGNEGSPEGKRRNWLQIRGNYSLKNTTINVCSLVMKLRVLYSTRAWWNLSSVGKQWQDSYRWLSHKVCLHLPSSLLSPKTPCNGLEGGEVSLVTCFCGGTGMLGILLLSNHKQ